MSYYIPNQPDGPFHLEYDQIMFHQTGHVLSIQFYFEFKSYRVISDIIIEAFWTLFPTKYTEKQLVDILACCIFQVRLGL